MKELLLPAGFERRSSGLYVRHIGQQVQGIDFQTDFPRFYVNVQFHYDFLPTLWIYRRKASHPWTWEHFSHVLDFLFRTRLNRQFLHREPIWEELGLDEDPEHCLTDAAQTSLSMMDALYERWGDPAVFYQILKPHVLRTRTFQMDRPFTGCGAPLSIYLLSPWATTVDAKDIARFMWLMAERDGKASLRSEYRQIERDLHEFYLKTGVHPADTPLDPVLLGD